MTETLVAKIAKQLKTEVRASCTGTPEPQGKPWHAAIEREGTRYCCHYGHGDTAEEAVINALVENVHSLKAEIKKLQPKAATTNGEAPTNGELVTAS